jgi:hypothetical protein
MSLLESAIYVLVFVLGSCVLLLPIIPAWYYSRRPDRAFPKRRFFILVCLLVSYGFTVAASVVFVPIELIAIYLAPQWEHDGHTTIVKAITGSSLFSTYFGFGIGLLSSILVPRWLSVRWPHIADRLA